MVSNTEATAMRPTLPARVLTTLAFLVCGCGGDVGEPEPLTLGSVSDQVSDCGGFTRAALQAAEPVPAPAYCDAEVLRWAYEPGTQTLTVTNTRVTLNCCGVHSMDLSCTTQGCTATETDAPQEGGLRCRCTCVYDYQVAAGPFAAAVIPLTLARDVTDDAAYPVTVWSGMIDLAAGSGSVVIDAEPVPMGCEPPVR
jgi:hypothetical protein